MSINTFSARSLPPFVIYAGFLVLVFTIGGIGSYATMPQIAGWYSTLVKPSFSPPNWLFGPVWTLLYVMIAFVGARLTLNEVAPREWRRQALIAFWLQMVLNGIWSPVFFSLHAIGLAQVIAVGMWLSIAATIIISWRFDRIAGLALVPYLCWVTFANILNAALFVLN